MPLEDFQAARRALNLIGYEGVTMIAIAKAANLPLARFLGGSVGAVPADNSNGLWLGDGSAPANAAAERIAEGGFAALKHRLGRDRLDDDLHATAAVRKGRAQRSNAWPISTRACRWRRPGIDIGAIAHIYDTAGHSGSDRCRPSVLILPPASRAAAPDAFSREETRADDR